MIRAMKKIIAIGVASILILPASVHAAISFQEPAYSEAYIQWLSLPEEERANYIEPVKYAISFERKDNQFPVQKISEKASRSRYSLAEDVDITVKNQLDTGSCWAQVATTQVTTNLSLLTKKTAPDVSSRHMEYATSRFFANGEENVKGFNRSVGDGGNYMMATAYLTSGQGAVLETDFPFENNENLIPLAQLNSVKPKIQLKDFEYIADISKSYDANGYAVYTETPMELKNIRNKIKEYIVQYGVINVTTYVGNLEYFSTRDVFYNDNVAYYCNGADTNYLLGDHSVSIIGWDDTYSRTNFRPGNQPKNDGAYIVQNSWGSEFGDNGIYYVSYDDFLIESQLMSMTNTSQISYDKLYQYDPYGGLIGFGIEGEDVYAANVFTRDTDKKEVLTEVGIYLMQDTPVELYINTKGDDKSIQKANYHQVVGMLSAGYHTIPLTTPQTLETDTFVIGIQVNGYIAFEVNMPGTFYSYVEAEENESFISMDGIYWEDFYDPDMPANVCAKAFTTIAFTSETATELPNYNNTIYIMQNQTVGNILTTENFQSAVRNDIKVLDKSGKEKERTAVIGSGDTICIINQEGKEVFRYTIGIKGDVNKDDKVKLYDAFKILETVILTSDLTKEQTCIMDYNDDGKVSLYDAFKFLEIAIIG